MRNKGKKLLIAVSFACMAFSCLPFVPVGEVCAMEDGAEGIMPLADVLEWRYKLENGVMYKRQFNRSTGKWVGSWVRC